MYEPQLRDQVSQGDIFDDVPITYVTFQDGATPISNTYPKRAMMLTWDCEHDKAINQWVMVAEIYALSDVTPTNQNHIRGYRVKNAFYLKECDAFPESYVEFRHIDRLHKIMLQVRSAEGKRIASLTDESRLALQQHLSVFFGFTGK